MVRLRISRTVCSPGTARDQMRAARRSLPSSPRHPRRCWTKLVRADEHLQALLAETNAFLDSAPSPYTIDVRQDLERARFLFYIERVMPPPSSSPRSSSSRNAARRAVTRPLSDGGNPA